MTQEQLSTQIGEELDRWQVILEYGRIQLDNDKSIRNKYKWLSYLKESAIVSLIATVFGVIVSSISDIEILWYIIVALSIVFLFLCLLLWGYRIEIRQLVTEEERKELETLHDKLGKYLLLLSNSIRELDCHVKIKQTDIDRIAHVFDKAREVQYIDDNNLSRLHGKLRPEWEQLAKEYAMKRLEPLLQYYNE